MYFRNLFRLYHINRGKGLILGRWSIPENKEYLDRKIYLANYDHCGPCGKLVLKSDPKNKNK
mgnify:CR=1 FL=1